MKTVKPYLERIDHLHVYTKNRDAAQSWYEDILGFNVVDKYSEWAEGGGPLVMENQNGCIELALFERMDFTPSSIIAFGVDGESFLHWKTFLEDKDLLTACKDHTLTWSLYFSDLDGNNLEITTKDYGYVSARV